MGGSGGPGFCVPTFCQVCRAGRCSEPGPGLQASASLGPSRLCLVLSKAPLLMTSLRGHFHPLPPPWTRASHRASPGEGDSDPGSHVCPELSPGCQVLGPARCPPGAPGWTGASPQLFPGILGWGRGRRRHSPTLTLRRGSSLGRGSEPRLSVMGPELENDNEGQGTPSEGRSPGCWGRPP